MQTEKISQSDWPVYLKMTEAKKGANSSVIGAWKNHRIFDTVFFDRRNPFIADALLSAAAQFTAEMNLHQLCGAFMMTSGGVVKLEKPNCWACNAPQLEVEPLVLLPKLSVSRRDFVNVGPGTATTLDSYMFRYGKTVLFQVVPEKGWVVKKGQARLDDMGRQEVLNLLRSSLPELGREVLLQIADTETATMEWPKPTRKSSLPSLQVLFPSTPK